MKHVLVTGAGGFLGQELCEFLHAEGLAVRALSRVPLSGKKYECVAVRDFAAVDTPWSRLLSGVDAVVHLAARVHQMTDSSADSLREYRRVNVEGTVRLAQAAADAGAQRFIFASSVKVNGDESPAGAPLKESDIPHPPDPYGLSKYEAEIALQGIAMERSLALAQLRLPLLYGPGVKANFLRLMRAVARGIPLPLSCARTPRSFLFTGNFTAAVLQVLRAPRLSGDTFFVSDGEDISVAELLRRVGEALQRPAHLWPMPEAALRMLASGVGKKSEVQRLFGHLQVDSTKFRRTFDWRAPFSVAQGLQATADWYKRSFPA